MNAPSPLRSLSQAGLLNLADALLTGRLHPPYHESLVQQYVPESLHGELAAELQGLAHIGMQPAHIGRMVKLLAEERAAAQSMADRVELVWSGMDVLGAVSRDTRVVIQELFRSAKKSVLISSFVVDAGEKSLALFGPLAKRMDEDPAPEVRLFVNIARPYGDDQTPDSVILREFAERFRTEIWPGKRLPEVHYDPRALSKDMSTRASLHAKCVVVDGERVFITSANFTQAAQERNIEAGVLITDPTTARALVGQFDGLTAQGAFQRVPGE